MRRSPKRHPLAILRAIIQLRQKEIAEIIDCPLSTYQKLELGKSPLTEEETGKLFQRISFQTRVSFSYLMNGDPKGPVVDQAGNPYTKEVFSAVRADLKKARTSAVGRFDIDSTIAGLICRLLGIVFRAHRGKEFAACTYKISEALNEVARRFPLDAKFEEEAKPIVFSLQSGLRPKLGELGFHFDQRFQQFCMESLVKTAKTSKLDPRDAKKLQSLGFLRRANTK